MAELLYLEDPYLKEFEAEIEEVTDEGVILNRTAFYPRSGGLEGDRGILVVNGKEYRVLGARKVGDRVLHLLDTTEGLEPGMKVKGIIDWENRYRQMRLHTASHIISALFYDLYGAMVTGGHITAEKAKEMYNVEKITPEMIREVFSRANEIVKRDLPVKVYWMEREEALKIPGIVKLASKMPPEIRVWRIVEIPGVDIQADGGPHVSRTGEIGEIVFLKKENKGKGKKVVVFTVKP
ncbi:MAG: alanyl-tRNA editing protein [Candidatus Diapherotrites archaeon]|nr:alanyl-tRNA editing protein [Candidatus Diapherotrites archaeon]